MNAASRLPGRRALLSNMDAVRQSLTFERDADGRRPIAVTAVIAGAAAAGVGLLLCIAIAVIGWFLADGGAHGDTPSAIGVGVNLWVLGNGASLTTAIGPIGLLPMGLTAVLLLVCFRSARWAVDEREFDDPTLAGAVGLFVGAYLVLCVIGAVAASTSTSSASIPGAIIGGFLVPLVGGGAGFAVASGRLATLWDGTSYAIRSALRIAVFSALVVLGIAAVGAAISFLFNFGEATRMYSGQHLEFRDALSVTVANIAFIPNVIAWGAAYLLGPGFAFGTGTSVSAGTVALGPMPAEPVLASFPHNFAGSGWLALLIAVPPLVALVVAGREQRATPSGETNSWDQVALRAFSGGASAGVLLWLVIAVSGGSMGSGRMAQIGASGFEVLLAGFGMGFGALLGGVLVAWLDKRRS